MAKQFKIERIINAPVERVWDAWVNIEKFGQWFGPAGFKARVKEYRFEPGGCIHSCLSNDFGVEMWAKFVYLTIEPLKHIQWEHSFSDEDGNLTHHPMAPTWPLKMLANLNLEDLGDKTKITLTLDAIECNETEIATFEMGFPSMEIGWGATWNQLDAFLAKENL